MMNKNKIVKNMIKHIEKIEKKNLDSKIFNEDKTNKSDIVNSIIDMLEKETENED